MLGLHHERTGEGLTIKGSRVNYKVVVDKIYSDINKKYGTNIPAPQ